MPKTQHRTVMLRLFIFSAVLALLAACGGSAGTDDAADLAPKAQAGKPLYETYCMSCHGSGGHGDGPAAISLQPSPANLAELQQTSDDAALITSIEQGVSGTAMVGWQGLLSDEQIGQIVAYLRILK